jgi:hypothetical protein
MISARKLVAAVAATCVTASVLVFAAPGAAQATACGGRVRYASTSNTIYLQSGSATLSAIAALCPSAPLTLVDPSRRIWELRGDLVVQNGATLVLHGGAVAGDVDVLRLRSLASAAKTDVSAITAQYGQIDVNTVAVTSWDDATGTPDTHPALPAGAAPDARGRAFIRAVSFLDPDGTTPRESRMDIANSDLGYLGWYGAESYGVAYKSRGCDATHLSVCAALDVFGSETNSRFHNNYMGTYTFDAEGMNFAGNEYDHNTMYGLDPHDDSDNLTITGNHFHDNGDHGLICSQRCNGLEISHNESDHNGIPPFTFPGDDDSSDNQVHGIMIHRGVTDTTIEDNYVHDQPNGAGIAVFDSSGDTIKNNLVVGAKHGLRYSVGATRIATLGNRVIGSSQDAVFTYQGSDAATYATRSGRPTNLSFSGNTFSGSGSNILKINDADGTTFTGNTVSGTVGSARMQNATGTVFSGVAYPVNQLFATVGSTARRGSTRIAGATLPTKVSVDAHSGVTLTNTDHRVYDLAAPVPTVITAVGGTLALTSTQLGTATATITPRALWISPSAGTATGRVTGFTSATSHVFASVGAVGTKLTITIGGRAASHAYTLKSGSTVLARATSTASGQVTFVITPVSTAVVDYTVAAGA